MTETAGSANFWLLGDSEMARRIKDHDWTATPLGPMEQWPSSLRVTLNTVLAHPLPMILAWGPELIALYNDAYRPLLGSKPEALGRPYLEVWSEVRDIILPQVELAIAGRLLQHKDAPFNILRGDHPEEAFFDYSYTPVRDETGVVMGIIHTAIDVTGRKRTEANRVFLDEIGSDLASLSSPDEIMQTVGAHLGEFLHLSSCIFSDVDEERNEVTINHGWIASGAPNLKQTFQLKDYVSEEFSRGAHAHEVFVVNDTAHDPRVNAENYANLKIGSFVVVHFHWRGRWTAYLAVTDIQVRVWQPDEIELLQEVANRIFPRLERARAEAALRHSEAKYRSLFQTMDQGYAEVELLRDTSGKVVDAMLTLANPAYERQSGIPVDKLIGRPILEVFPDFDPWWAQQYDKVAATGVPARFERRLVEVDRWFMMNVVPRDRDHVQCLFDDITQSKRAEQALRASEERFRLFVENVREYALVQTDFEGIITSWNPGAERLFGYTSEEVVGQPFSMLLPEEDRHEGIIAREMATLSHGTHVIDAHMVQRKDGSCFWAEWITEPVLDDAGKLRGTAKVMRDETERQQAEKALKRSLAEKEELLKEVHHRVKNNLQVITSLLNLQANTLDDDRTLVLFDEARNRVQSISAIHELLYKSESFASINLHTYAEQLISSLVQFYGMQNRVVTKVLGDDAAIELERAVPFGLLLNELVSNALKHGFPDGRKGEVQVEVRRTNEDIVLRVSDTGVGLPSDLEYKEAASLGLKLVRILIRQLRGTIEAISEEGAVFEVHFPARDNRRRGAAD